MGMRGRSKESRVEDKARETENARGTERERERERRESSQKLSKAVWHSRATGRSICELDVSAIRM